MTPTAYRLQYKLPVLFPPESYGSNRQPFESIALKSDSSMADSTAPSATLETNSQRLESGAPSNHSDPATQPSGPGQPSFALLTVPNANPNLNPQILSTPMRHPSAFSYAPSQVSGGYVVSPATPSFRPVPQFSPLLTLNYQNPSFDPPGVSSASPTTPGVAMSGAGVLPGSQPQSRPLMGYQIQGQQPNPSRHFAPISNGYAVIPPGPQGVLNPMGIPRYPTPYGTLVRPLYPPRHLGITGVLPTMRSAVVPMPTVHPVIAPGARPAVAPNVTADKTQTTVYVGKIAPSLENDFILSLLQLCGPFKNWKRAQNPSDGTYISFGFCEFESAEGVLRALRLLSRFKIDGQELLTNVDQATREHLECYVKKKTENFRKLKETPGARDTKTHENAQTAVSNDSGKSSIEKAEKNADDNLANNDIPDSSNFGIVTDQDKEADQVALDKLTNMIEERLKTKPLPPPPYETVLDATGKSNSEFSAKPREGDSDSYKNGEPKKEEEANHDNKPTSKNDRCESISPKRNRMNDRRSKEHDRERDLKRVKEMQIEKYEREAEREHYKKEREQRRKMEEAERYYDECLKEWEYREKDKEKQNKYEKEREKERESMRKKEILNDESDESDDSRKRLRKSVLEEKRKKQLLEKEDDLADIHKEEQEIAEAKSKTEEGKKQQQQKDLYNLSAGHLHNGDMKPMVGAEVTREDNDRATHNNLLVNSDYGNHIGDANLVNCIKYESIMALDGVSDATQGGIAPAKKLGFGLVASGKRAAVASVFHDEDDDDSEKNKKKRPLVPIDYSIDEVEATQPTATGAAPLNLAAATEFAKRISNANMKEEKQETDRDRNRHSNEKWDRERSVDGGACSRIEFRERLTERCKDHRLGIDKHKTSDNKKLLDAKEIIDLIPRTKEKLFSYNINWSVYDKNQIHERMRPWISKKIAEFLGEEETTLVDYIVSSTQEHVKASQMLELLQSILDEEAEMFVLKMWRMLIFEIKKVETGLESRLK